MAKGVMILLMLAALGWLQTNAQTVPPINNEVYCRPHILSQCRSLNYNTTLPNLRGQTSPSVIEEEFLQFEILFRYNCSNALLVLLCGVYAPFCECCSPDNTSVVLKPCRNLCNHVYNGCISVYNYFQYEWPEILNCSKFPEQSEEMCFGPSNLLDIEYPTVVSPNATIPLPPENETAPPRVTDSTTGCKMAIVRADENETIVAFSIDFYYANDQYICKIDTDELIESIVTTNSSNDKSSCLDNISNGGRSDDNASSDDGNDGSSDDGLDNSNDGSSDDDGVIAAMAALLGIAVIILVISIVINILLVAKLKQLRCDYNESNIRYSEAKESVLKEDSITEYTVNNYASEPEHIATEIDPKSSMEVDHEHDDAKMDSTSAHQESS